MNERPVVIAGATGFVGRAITAELVRRGLPVRGGSRRPERARGRWPEVDWVELDVLREGTLRPALSGARAVVYLVHRMEGRGRFDVEERLGATAVARAAADAGLDRIVFLGGVEPAGKPSEHLRSRLETGRILRGGRVPTLELRASMVIGSGSQSWRIVSDIALRVPFLVLPRWLGNRLAPVALTDVVAALARALEIPLDSSAVYDIPGPEVLSSREIIERTARICGRRPVVVEVPFMSPRVASMWIRLLTRADPHIASRIIAGLKSDLVPSRPVFWQHLAGHRLMGFDDAARAALREEAGGSPGGAKRWARGLSRWRP